MWKYRATLLVLGFLVGFSGMDVTRAATTWYVDAGSTGPTHDGTTWCRGFITLQQALDAASIGDDIRVAQGTYKPSIVGLNNPRNATFLLKSGISVEGGFAGCGAANPDTRDFVAFKTTLSGDLSGDDGPNFAQYSDNCYHVVTYADPTATGVILEGFAISGGNANGNNASTNQGGGIHIRNGLARCLPGGPTIRHCVVEKNWGAHHGAINDHGLATVIESCVIRDNHSALEGGGLQVHSGSPTVTNCTFLHNTSDGQGGGAWVGSDNDPTCTGPSTAIFTNCIFDGNVADVGGGVYTTLGANPTVSNCTFVHNVTFRDGAGLFATGSSPTISDCLFDENTANGQGGAVYNTFNAPTFSRCTFRRNSGALYAGAMRNLASNPVLTDCVFAQNWTSYNGGALHNRLSSPTIDRCAFFGNTAVGAGGALFNIESSTLSIRDSLFVGNRSDYQGGAVFTDEDSNVDLKHCTLFANAATLSPAAIQTEFGCSTALSNSIVWNHPSGAIGGGGTSTAQYSNIQGGFAGVGNINVSPIFVDADGPDNVIGTEDDDLRLKRNSSGVNVGDPGYVPAADELDLAGGPRLVNCRVDMGAHETIFLQEPGDFNADHAVNLADLASLQLCAYTPDQHAGWQQACLCVFDFTSDGHVDLVDFALFPWDAQPCDEGNDAACDDGDACNGQERCVDRVCRPGTPLQCDDGNICTDDACVEGGCVAVPNSVFCDDQDACTIEDRCNAGTCGGAPIDCDDGNICTIDGCSPDAGCSHTPNTLPCEDGDACTVDDHCAEAICVSGSSAQCDDANPCTDDACEPASGCIFTPHDANACSDGDLCNGTETCQSGSCVPGSPLACDDGNPCTDDACASSSGCVFVNDDANACGDGNTCNGPETCQGGICAPGSPLVCDDHNPCTDDSCDPTAGCLFVDDDANACADADACNGAETCQAGECIPGTPLTCDDNNPCTDDVCDPQSGCVFTANDANACTDADVCSGQEHCNAGLCLPGEPLVCDDGNPCTDDSCDPLSGCVFVNDDANDCDDADACTLSDACVDGVCSGTSVDCSQAGDPCHTAQCDPLGPEGNCDILIPIPDAPGCGE